MGTHPMKILIAEDDSSQRDLLVALLLQKFQCEVLQAEDGLETLQIMLKDCPDLDLAILDMTMPYVDGRQILSIIKSHPHLHELPVIACTAHNTKEKVAEILRYGVAAFIVKPIVKPILYAKIAAVLKKVVNSDGEDSKNTFPRTKEY